MDSRDERWLCERVRVIDTAVGGLQGTASEHEELIEKLTKRIAKLEGKFMFWFIRNEWDDEQAKEKLEQIALQQEWDEEQETKEGGDDAVELQE